jgi:hypothetical protein
MRVWLLLVPQDQQRYPVSNKEIQDGEQRRKKMSTNCDLWKL